MCLGDTEITQWLITRDCSKNKTNMCDTYLCVYAYVGVNTLSSFHFNSVFTVYISGYVGFAYVMICSLGGPVRSTWPELIPGTHTVEELTPTRCPLTSTRVGKHVQWHTYPLNK